MTATVFADMLSSMFYDVQNIISCVKNDFVFPVWYHTYNAYMVIAWTTLKIYSGANIGTKHHRQFCTKVTAATRKTWSYLDVVMARGIAY